MDTAKKVKVFERELGGLEAELVRKSTGEKIKWSLEYMTQIQKTIQEVIEGSGEEEKKEAGRKLLQTLEVLKRVYAVVRDPEGKAEESEDERVRKTREVFLSSKEKSFVNIRAPLTLFVSSLGAGCYLIWRDF